VEQFLSTFTNRVDRKGRVSVPAEFRSVLTARKLPNRVLLYPALYYDAIEGAGEDYLAELDRQIATLPPLSQERDDLVFTVKPSIRPFSFDEAEGRIVLSEELIKCAGLADSATFVGLGGNFQIWKPENWEAQRQISRSRTRGQRPGAPR
jgi:MraZ protein